MPKQDQFQICPYILLLSYLKLRGRAAGSLFIFPGGKDVSRHFFTEKLKMGLIFCGLDIARYKSHSFRIGGASYYASLGFSDVQIQYMGRWNSEAFKKYIRSVSMIKVLKIH